MKTILMTSFMIYLLKRQSARKRERGKEGKKREREKEEGEREKERETERFFHVLLHFTVGHDSQGWLG